MYTADNKALVRRFLEDAYSAGKLELLDELLAPSYVDRDAPPGTPPGRDGIRALMTTFRSAFPDFHFTIEDQIAEGDKVATRYTVRGTHQGALFGIPPTGKQVTVRGISVYRIADGQLHEAWVNYDALGMMQQLGVVPLPG